MERKSFDNKHVTFEEHVTTEHNMWHYLYFTVLVKVKDPTEFTGPESYVHEMVKVKIIEIHCNNKYYNRNLKYFQAKFFIIGLTYFIYSNEIWNGFLDFKPYL